MKAVLAVNETNFESEVLRSNQAIIAGFWAAQYLPFLHEIAVAAFAEFETEIYRAQRCSRGR